MKNLFKNPILFLVAILFMFGGMAYANTTIDHPDNMLKSVDKKGKYIKMDVSSLPKDKEVSIRVRDHSERLLDHFTVTNTGQNYVLVNLNRLKPGIYSMNILRGENDIIRKTLNIHWNQVVLNDVSNISRDGGHETRWPLFLVR